ncbi:MAG: hypothetical protein ACLRNQ_11310 [Flavonifractor plautii]
MEGGGGAAAHPRRGETLWAYLEEGQALRAKVLTAADTFGAVEWRRVSGMNTVMTDYFALAPRHARDAILPIKHPLRTDDIHYIQAQKQTLLALHRLRPRPGPAGLSGHGPVCWTASPSF